MMPSIYSKGRTIVVVPSDASTLAAAARRRRRRARIVRPLFVAAITVLVLFKMTVLPSVSDTDSLLGDFVRFRNIDRKEQFEDPKPLAVPAAPVIDVDVSALPFDPVLPATLPLGYRLVASELPSDYTLNLFFEHSDGSSFMLLESPAKPGAFVLPPDGGDWATGVDNSPVLVTADPRPHRTHCPRETRAHDTSRTPTLQPPQVTDDRAGGRGSVRSWYRDTCPLPSNADELLLLAERKQLDLL